MIKERPILFSAPMVRAILEGRKTHTRRVVKPQPNSSHWESIPGYKLSVSKQAIDQNGRVSYRFYHTIPQNPDPDIAGDVFCQYGKPGDILWVRETWAKPYVNVPAVYRADYNGAGILKWNPSIHMPRRLSRINLEITDILIERLNNISEDDANSEGCPECPVCQVTGDCGQWGRGAIDDPLSNAAGGRPWRDCRGPCDGKTGKEWFKDLWDSINSKKYPWESNPWVWVIKFKFIQ